MDYEVGINQSGCGGTIFYVENSRELPFGWELATNGALIFFPPSQDWNDFDDENDSPMSQNRRDEILKRLCEEVIRQKAAGAKYTIGDVYISIAFR